MARIRRSDWLQIGFWSMRHNLLCGAFLCFVVPTRISVGAPVRMHRRNGVPRSVSHGIIRSLGPAIIGLLMGPVSTPIEDRLPCMLAPTYATHGCAPIR